MRGKAGFNDGGIIGGDGVAFGTGLVVSTAGVGFFAFVSNKNNDDVFLYFGVVQIWRIPQVTFGQRMTWLSFKLTVLMQSGQISNGFTATGFWWWFVSMA